MKTNPILLLLIFVFNASFAQEVAIEISKIDYIYERIANTMTITAARIPCSSLYVTANGKELSGKNCEYTFGAKKAGERLEIEVFEVKKGDTCFLQKRIFGVHPIPLPIPQLGNKRSGKMGIGELKAQRGVITIDEYYYLYGCAHTPVTRFRIIVLRNEDLIGTTFNKGAVFESQTKALLEKVQVGDKVYFVDIFGKHFLRPEETILNPIELEIE
ncbi:MAG: GldM family protein [Chitinophagales bacterium]